MSDWNAKIIEEFRENDGKVGGQFEGAPMVLVHHRGRRTGAEHVVPLVYLPDEQDADVVVHLRVEGGCARAPAVVSEPDGGRRWVGRGR